MKLPKLDSYNVSTTELEKNIFRLINLIMDFTAILNDKEFTNPRELLNKIIHATYLNHDIQHDNKSPYYMPSLQLLGYKGKKEWWAEIHLLPFCKVLYDFTSKNKVN